MKGSSPEREEQLRRAAAITAGSARDELIAAYGRCLERATWLPGRGGGATVELFHVVKGCRARLPPRYFRVSNDRVELAEDGDLDDLVGR